MLWINDCDANLSEYHPVVFFTRRHLSMTVKLWLYYIEAISVCIYVLRQLAMAAIQFYH